MNLPVELSSLKSDILSFMEKMKYPDSPGRYRYSLTGDLYDHAIRWNVGASVFALKIYYTLGIEINDEISAAAEFIRSFHDGAGRIFSPFIRKKSFVRNIKHCLKTHDLGNIFNTAYIRAETRQCCSALLLYDELPRIFPIRHLGSPEEIDTFLGRLDWSRPWHAGSHFSHIMFFLNLAYRTHRLTRDQFNLLTDHAVLWVNRLHDPESGGWIQGTAGPEERINGAMKVITGLVAVDKPAFPGPEELIDLCLSCANDDHACGNFNIIYVLHYASKLTGHSYRQSDIEAFALKRLHRYFDYYHPAYKGFSFYPGRANDIYYGAKITRGHNEPDIHGTSLLLWGIAIILQILDLEKEFGLREYKT